MLRAHSRLVELQARQRLVFRCVGDFILDQFRGQIVRHEGHFLRAAICMAVLQASRAPGRSISVRALAQSLRLPYESTRRHVLSLEARGLCMRSSASSVTATPLAAAQEPGTGAADVLAALRRLYAALAALGVDAADLSLSAIRSPAPAPDSEFEPQVAALVTDFLLRVLEESAQSHGTLLDALVFTALLQINASPITYSLQLAWRYAAHDAPPPDAARRPASLSEVAARIGMPKESVRRRMLRFLEDGRCVKTDGGYLASMDYMQSAEVLRSGLAVTRRFSQLTRGLSEIGVELAPPGDPPESVGLRA